MNARILLIVATIMCFGAIGCSTHSDRTKQFRAFWGAGAYAEAEAEIDRLISEDSGVEVEEIGDGTGDFDMDSGDTCLFLMEKAMVRLARNDPQSAITILRQARDVLDDRLITDAGAYFEKFASAVTDDTALSYSGADYEHITIRVMLAICDLLVGGDDAFAYSSQVGEKQEEIIGSTFGEVEDGEDYKPRESYQRVSAGAYLQGLIRELNLAPDEACRAYKRAQEYTPGNELYEVSTQRACKGNYVQAGNGVVHVFYLVGLGPHLAETTSAPTDLALRLAGVAMAIIGKSPTLLAQKPVPVPVVAVSAPFVAPLQVESGDVVAETTVILDVNMVAQEQLNANMPWILARAVVRRALKAAAAELTGAAVKQGAGEIWGFVTKIVTSFLLTAAENADTRNWATLPAQIQATRFELPGGVHELTLSDGNFQRVKVTKGRDTYVVVLRPNTLNRGTCIVDQFSQPPAEEPQPAEESGTPEPTEEMVPSS